MSLPKIGLIGGGFQHAFSTTLWKKPTYFEWSKQRIEEKTFYIDDSIKDGINKPGNNYAWLLESRTIIPNAIKFVQDNVEEVSKSFIYLFTHYKAIADLAPNFIYIAPHGFWIENYGIHQKTKIVSMVSSAKNMCRGHQHRLNWVNKLRPHVDLYGRGFREVAKKDEAINDYMFSITIENDQYETYWSEKILDCFISGTIPVYYGAPDIGNYFNKDGIIELTDNFNIQSLTPELYYSKMDAIQDNYKRALKYDVIEDILWKEYLNV